MDTEKQTHDLVSFGKDLASAISASTGLKLMLEQLAAASDSLEESIGVAVGEARELPVSTPGEFLGAGEFLKKIKATQDVVMDQIGPLVKKAHECHKAAKAIENAFMAPLDNLVGAVKVKMARLLVLQEIETRATDTLIDESKVEEAYRLAEEGKQEEAEALLVEAGYFTPEEIPDALPKVKGVSIRRNWKWEVNDEKKLPRKYMVPDRKAIGGVVKSLKDKTDIKGVRVWSEPSLAVSAK